MRDTVQNVINKCNSVDELKGGKKLLQLSLVEFFQKKFNIDLASCFDSNGDIPNPTSFQELIVEAKEKNEKERKARTYQEILEDFKRKGFIVTPAEAVYLRQVIDEVFKANREIDDDPDSTDSMEYLFTYPEVIRRFFWNYYAINIDQVRDSMKMTEKELYQYIQTVLRREKEELE